MCFGEGWPGRLADEYHVRRERREESNIIGVQVFDLISCLKVLLFIAIEEIWDGADLWESVSRPVLTMLGFSVDVK